MRLVVSLATRGRPAQLIDTVNRSIANWVNPNTVMNIALDADDAETINGLNANAPHAWFVGPSGPRVNLDMQPREDTVAAKWNRALKIPGDLYLMAADDDPYITPGYDQKLLEATKLLPDGLGMVYGHMNNLSFSGVQAMTAKLAERLGYLQPEYFPYWFCDHWTDDLVRYMNRIAFADVRTDLSKAGKTQELREPAWWATWFDAGYLTRRKLAHSIIDSDEFKELPETKERQKAMFRRVEHYSCWVNDNVRAQDKQLAFQMGGLNTKDERYQRVKAKAVAMLPQLLDGMDEDQKTDVMLGRPSAQQYREFLIPSTEVAGIPQAYKAA
jgi:hypothetical protein